MEKLPNLKNQKHLDIVEICMSSDLDASKLGNIMAKKLGFIPVDIKTLKLLSFCTPYYEFIGIRERTPQQIKNNSTWGISFSVFGQPFILDKDSEKYKGKDGRLDGSPAIWRASEFAQFNSSCGNSHQSQINDQGTTGLYQNIKGKWYKIK